MRRDCACKASARDGGDVDRGNLLPGLPARTGEAGRGHGGGLCLAGESDLVEGEDRVHEQCQEMVTWDQYILRVEGTCLTWPRSQPILNASVLSFCTRKRLL